MSYCYQEIYSWVFVLRQQWQNEKNGLEAHITKLEKELKRNEENSKKQEKDNKKVCDSWYNPYQGNDFLNS